MKPRQRQGDDMFIVATVESLREKMDRSDSMPKKRRLKTSQDQLQILQQAFDEDPKPSTSIRNELAEKLGMTPRGVQVWFQNKRAKAKSCGQLPPGRPQNALKATAPDSPSQAPAVNDLFADLNTSNPSSTSTDNMNEFVSDSDDDAVSITSSLLSASSVSTIGMTHLNISGLGAPPQRVNNIHGSSVYGNTAFTRSLPDLHSMKCKQKQRMGWPNPGYGISNLGISSAWDQTDDYSESSSLPGSPNPFRIAGVALLHTPSQVPQRPLTPVIPLPAAENPIPQPLVTIPQPLVNASSDIRPEVRPQRRHSLHAEISQPGGVVPASVLLQLQNNYLALQQQQAGLLSTPVSMTSDASYAWMHSPAGFSSTAMSPEIQQLQYTLHQQHQYQQYHNNGINQTLPSNLQLSDMFEPDRFSISPAIGPVASSRTSVYPSVKLGQPYDSNLDGAGLSNVVPYSVTDLMQASMFGLPSSNEGSSGLMDMGLLAPSCSSENYYTPATTHSLLRTSPAMQEEFRKLIKTASPPPTAKVDVVDLDEGLEDFAEDAVDLTDVLVKLAVNLGIVVNLAEVLADFAEDLGNVVDLAEMLVDFGEDLGNVVEVVVNFVDDFGNAVDLAEVLMDFADEFDNVVDFLEVLEVLTELAADFEDVLVA
ncbi:hypothetical protein HDU67_002658 [Dinochytrium kinnereticum]|nr:hypothetical protein HDU67_002658 [Dinochytrium kinnereticum]